MGNLFSEDVKKSLSGRYARFDANGRMGPSRIISIKRVKASEGDYADEDGMLFRIEFFDGQIYNTISRRLVRALEKVDAGDTVVIKRQGEGYDVSYEVEVTEKSSI